MLRFALERIMQQHGLAYQIYEFSSGEGLLGWLDKHQGELNLVFLDIEMHGLSGMETARLLREQDMGLQLVFVTGYADYVYDGYTVSALGYLLKPPKQQQLEEVVGRALIALDRDTQSVFVCRSGETSYRISRRDILYFVSDKRQVQCVTPARTYTFYGKLDDVEQQLTNDSFVRIHQRYLVYAMAVERLDRVEVTLQGGYILPISRSYQNVAMVALTRAMLK